MKCSKCGTIIEDGTKFCYKCGTPVTQTQEQTAQTQEQFTQKLPVFCQKCGTELFSDDLFCPSCGCPVNGDGTRPDDGAAGKVNGAYDTGSGSTLYNTAYEEKAPEKEKSNTLIIVIIITAVVLLIAGAAIFFIFDPFGMFGGGEDSGGSTATVTETVRETERPTERSSNGKMERETERSTERPTERPDDESLQTASGYNYIVDERFIDMSDVRGMDQTTTRRLINEMYARHGYIFKDKDIQRYFDNQSWYYGNTTSQDEVKDRFNIYEEENIKILIKYEEEMGWR